MPRAHAAAAGLLLSACAGLAVAQPCSPRWEVFPDGPDVYVNALHSFTDAGGPALFVGGRFETVGGQAIKRIARYDGNTWQGLGAGIPGEFNSHGIFGCCANVFSIHGDIIAGVPTLHIGGDFITIDGITAESVARWDGAAWHDLAGGVAQESGCFDCAARVYKLLRHADGNLYATGGFVLAGGAAATPVNSVARWTGTQWQPLTTGLSRDPQEPWPTWGNSLATFNGDLYVGGAFGTAGGVVSPNLARWNGSAGGWSAVGGGITQDPQGPTPNLNALLVFDDGSGDALYAAGYFTQAGDTPTPARHIAKWNGAAWSALGSGIGDDPNDQVHCLAAFDDGSGMALYVGGQFLLAGGQSATNIARWRNGQWSAVGGGGGTDGTVQTMAVHRGALYVGGGFTSAGGQVTLNLARYVGCANTCYANCDSSTALPVLNVADFTCFLTKYAATDPYANCDTSTEPPTLNVADFTCFLTKFAAGCP